MPKGRTEGGAHTAEDGLAHDRAAGSSPGPDAPPGPVARVAVGAVFFVNGAAFATWAARVPAVRDGLGLSAAGLSVALTGLAAGAFLGLPLAGALVARWGSRRVLAGAALYLGALPLIALAPRLTYLTAMLALFAIGNSALDVAMNTQGALAERTHRRPLMGGFHAMFSLGGVTGAAVGGLAASARVPVSTHFLLAAAALSAVCVASAAFLPPDRPGHRGPGRQVALPVRGLWAPGAIAFCALMAEGLMNDWGSVYLHDIADASPFTAATGFAVFSAGMVTGRLAADRIRARMRSDRFLRRCALLSGAGAVLALLLPVSWTGLTAYTLIGLGLAAIIPVTFSHAARSAPDRPGASIAAVSTLGYVGFLAGPPLVGVIAESTGLRAAMLVFLALMALMIGLAPALRPGPPEPPPRRGPLARAPERARDGTRLADAEHVRSRGEGR
jgi:predicted MFS family arabinose efflux permease